MRSANPAMASLATRVPQAVKVRLETMAGQGGKNLSDLVREILTRAVNPKRAATVDDLATNIAPKWSSDAIQRAHLSVFFRVEIQMEQIINLLAQGLAEGTGQGEARSFLQGVAQLDSMASTLAQLRDDMLRDVPKGPAP